MHQGLVGVARFDLVASIFGDSMAPAARGVWTVVGLAALYLALTWPAADRDPEHTDRGKDSPAAVGGTAGPPLRGS